MSEHSIFYYPYASFTNEQLPLLKAAAQYFDELSILDPLKATSGTIGLREEETEVALLEKAKSLKRIEPGDILEKYGGEIAASIRADMEDPDFLALCEACGRAPLWRLALAKVPKEIRDDPKYQPSDQAMKRLMGDLPRNLAPGLGRYDEVTKELVEGLQRDLSVYRETPVGAIEYRYNDYPLPLGEAIMMNHALCAGLRYTTATPVTDVPFHNKVLSLKLRRAAQDPAWQPVLADRAGQIGANLLAIATLADLTHWQLDLPTLNPKVPLQEVLEYRHKHKAALQVARDKLGDMAHRIKAEPWSQAFADDLEHTTIQDVKDQLNEVRQARDDYLTSQRVRLLLEAIGVATGAAVVTLAVYAAPLTPVALAIAGLNLTSVAAIPGMKWLLDLRDGKKTVQKNGLHYLLKYK